MKISCALLAFYAIGSTTAFAPTSTKKVFGLSAALGSNDDARFNTNMQQDMNKQKNVKPYSFDMGTANSMMGGNPSNQNNNNNMGNKRELQDRVNFLEKKLDRNAPNNNQNPAFRNNNANAVKDQMFWDNAAKMHVQGGSLKTWSYNSPAVDAVQIRLMTEGRPLDASVDLWQGPDNTPQRIRVYLEDGMKRPFQCVMVTPRSPNTIAIRNTGQLEFPFLASVIADVEGEEQGPMVIPEPRFERGMSQASMTIQGGALRTYPFDPLVESVQVLLRTDGRPLNARIELLQGPNNNKQVIEVYTEDGLDRPFYVVVETPGSGNVVRIVNMSTVEFPMTALVEPYTVVDNKRSSSQPVMGGDNSMSSSSRNSMMWQG